MKSLSIFTTIILLAGASFLCTTKAESQFMREWFLIRPDWERFPIYSTNFWWRSTYEAVSYNGDPRIGPDALCSSADTEFVCALSFDEFFDVISGEIQQFDAIAFSIP